MKKSLANQIEKLWNESHANYTIATQTHAEVEPDALGWRVRIQSTGGNCGDSFHCVGELAGIETAFKVSSYVTIWDGKIQAVIF